MLTSGAYSQLQFGMSYLFRVQSSDILAGHFRASGKGAVHVTKTLSFVREHHLFPQYMTVLVALGLRKRDI